MSTDKATDIKAFLTACVAALTALWGWLGWTIVFLILAMIIDYITGSIAAHARGEWSSAVARAGLRHKLGTIIAVGVAAFADLGVRVALHSAMIPRLQDFDWPQGFTMVVTFWYFLTELGSILENAGKLGAPLHPWVVKGIAVLRARLTSVDDAADSVPTVGTDGYHGKHETDAEDEEDKHRSGLLEDD